MSAFYSERAPDKAGVEACEKVLTKYKFKEGRLYKKLLKKYGEAPLHDCRALGSDVGPCFCRLDDHVQV